MSLSAIPRSHAAVASSPSMSRIAVTKSWNEPLVGATPDPPPVLAAAVSSSTDCGQVRLGHLSSL